MIPYKAQILTENVNVSRHSPVAELARLLAYATAGVVIVYGLLGLAADLLIQCAPHWVEQQLGQIVPVDKEMSTGPNAPGQKRLQHVLNALLEKNDDFPMQVNAQLIEEEAVNAMSLPGGHILVTQKLLDLTQTDDELAFVLGHELGHFAHHDHLRGLGRGILVSLAFSFLAGENSPLVGLLQQSIKLTECQFSHAQELYADQYALQLLMKTRYAPQAGIVFFEKMQKQQNTPAFMDFLATHPSDKTRIEQLKQKIALIKGHS